MNWVIRCGFFVLLTIPAWGAEPAVERRHIEPELRHLRSGSEREWDEFPAQPDASHLRISFTAKKNAAEQTLLLRQQDVKQVWRVMLNDQKLGELVRDENDLIAPFAIPAAVLKEGENTLAIESPASAKVPADDIRVGQIMLIARPVKEFLREATLEVQVTDAATNLPTPARITILNRDGAMQALGAASNETQAVRPGTIYTANGQAGCGLPEGRYTIFAGRGFEYSLAKAEVTLRAGETIRLALSIRREVPTEGYIACDPHVHTLTHSGHGDATLDERMITIAGEGIELPIATDHNCHVNYEDAALKLGVRRYFTPVMGNEVTTPRGHFNIFPIASGARVVDHQQTDWGTLFTAIEATPGVRVSILNHARDLHQGVRPFGPAHHHSLVGENLDGWPFRFNAMEVVNSGTTQSQPLQLLHDWMGLLNRGLRVTPVGSSDSHDVSRHFVGQGRTYIRGDDTDPGKLNLDEAVSNFLAGKVMVSYGLLAEITVNQRFHAGELATVTDGETLRVDVRVLGPHWTRASQIQLFANGQLIHEAAIPVDAGQSLPSGVKWSGGWTIPLPAHDVHLVAIATGPGIDGLFWKTAKPYQPVSTAWEARTIGCSGAVSVDADRDGRFTAPRESAERLFLAANGDWEKLVSGLKAFDEATAAQAAHRIRSAGTSLHTESLQQALKAGSPATQAGFRAYADAWRENEIARARP